MVMLPYRAPWDYETKPFQIVDNVYYVGNRNVSCHLFDTGEGLLLLDTGYTETAYLLFESIRELPYEEMLECFAENDLLLVPLEKNPFNEAKSNIKFIEAACGMTPVLAQNCREFLVIQDGVTGYLYDDDFFEKLEYIYAHRDSLPEVGYAARQYVEKHMTTACNACPELIDFINN